MLRAFIQDTLGSIAGLVILALCERFPLAALRAQRCTKVAVFDWDAFELRSIDGRLIAYSTEPDDVNDDVVLFIDSDGQYLVYTIHDDDFMSAYGYLMDWAFSNGYKVIRSTEV